jgi:hypothetical protein
MKIFTMHPKQIMYIEPLRQGMPCLYTQFTPITSKQNFAPAQPNQPIVNLINIQPITRPDIPFGRMKAHNLKISY